MVWINNKYETLGSTSDTMDATSMTASQFGVFLNHAIPDSNSTQTRYTVNGVSSGSKYASRQSKIGMTDVLAVSQDEVIYDSGGETDDKFSVTYACDIAGEEKLFIGFGISRKEAGGGNAPTRSEVVWKYVTTSARVTSVRDDTSAQTGTYAVGSNLSCLSDTGVSQVDRETLTNVPSGTRFEETDTRKMYRKATHGWKERDVTTYASMDSFRGCFCGGQNSTDTIDYITIETTGDATDFGDLTGNTGAAAGCDNNSRGVIGHGSNNVMDYITIATTGNATDFGDRNNTGDEIGACSDQTTRGIFFGGTAGSRESIDYVTIASVGNATDFGDMTDGRSAPAGLGDTTRGCMGGGSTGSIVNIIDYITIATTGNATDFGDLTQARRHLAGTADETRGVFAGGHASYNNIDYITIQTTGNATDFGDLVNGRYGIAGVSNYARGVFGSSNISGVSNQMDYITIATTGNATDFGDLTVARSNAGGVSGN